MHKICLLPFHTLNSVAGTVYPCCSGWITSEAHALTKSSNMTDIWFNDFEPFRQSIITGDYKYCRNDCPMLISSYGIMHDVDSIPEIKPFVIADTKFTLYPTEVTLSYDITCNLACKGCRKTIMSTSHHDITMYDTKYADMIANAKVLKISGDGDAFASPYYFNLLKSDLTKRCKNLEQIKISTNGLLFDEHHFNQIHPNNIPLISSVYISIDAASADVYKNYRGGDFNRLCTNLKYIRTLKDKYKWFIYSAYTVSSINFIDMPDFVDFAFANGIDTIQYWEMNEWGRGYSKAEYGIDTSSYEFNAVYNETLNRLSKLGDSIRYLMSLHPTESTHSIPQPKQLIPMNIHTTTKINPPYIKHDELHTPTISSLELDNTKPNASYAIYCPFYITHDNNGIWIDRWINNVANLEQSTPIFYTISYPDSLDIIKYNSHIEKLTKYGTCITIEPNLYHTDVLKIAHEYLKTNGYTYMVHIEQDVILTSQISNHIINKMIDDNSDYLITDIKGNDYFYNICDVDISIFGINVIAYDSDNYACYVTSDNIKDNLLTPDQLKYNIGACNKIPPLLSNLSNKDINKYVVEEINTVYKSNDLQHWIKFHIQNLNIENVINPLFIDSARAYPLHAYINGKLSIINGIEKYAKHLKESRRSDIAFNLTSIDNTIKYFGYSPIGLGSANTHILLDPYYTKGIDIVIISKNQETSLKDMMYKLRLDIPTANRIFVLDRCTDGSKELLQSHNEFFVERHDAVGFCAGSARNIGLKHTNPEHDVLFLDGDRIPHNLNYERIVQMLYYFNISMIKNEHDIRHFFVNVPSINTSYNTYHNQVWSSAILLRRSAINKITNIVGNENLFEPEFDGNWGCEDEYLGDIALHLNMLSGGFPNSIYVEGNTTNANMNDESIKHQYTIRNRLRDRLTIPTDYIKNKPLTRDEQRANIHNFIKNRER